ncbi:hypothetical protein L6164_027287 [Bauhinia variegata]|uniref:Uncharacterized protein n=1 Tax=Bauhinia variegata TaxID=167791 RepID=A0ACB9LSH2_BAUVA|nr:hypothetical protein L6164_027287 [Bauhinia variegata]
MAGTLAIVPSNGIENSLVNNIRDQWEVHFARFFPYPSITNSSCSSDLVPLGARSKNRCSKGNWMSSSSIAFLRLIRNHSNSDIILTVFFSGKVLVQKFALKFASIFEAQSFINALKEILKVESGPDPEPLNTDFGSEISSQSGFMSSNKHYHQPYGELSNMTPSDTYTPQMPPILRSEGERHTGTQEKETTLVHKFDGILPALPPGFNSLLMDCSENSYAQPIDSKENDLKSQIAKYMEDSSFQDMLVTVEKVISEIGGDMSL